MNVASAEDPSSYSLIVTNGTADTADDAVYHPPTTPVYTVTTALDGSKVYMVALTFGSDLALYGSGAFRLRIGDDYQPIVTTNRTDVTPNDDIDSTMQGATELGPYSNSVGQSWAISGRSVRGRTMEWPGGEDTPGAAQPPGRATNVDAESHFMPGPPAMSVPKATFRPSTTTFRTTTVPFTARKCTI